MARGTRLAHLRAAPCSTVHEGDHEACFDGVSFGPCWILRPIGSSAGGRSTELFRESGPAPYKAFELNVASAYNQAWGNLTDTQSVAGQVFGGRQVQDVAGAGLQFELDLGYRVLAGARCGRLRHDRGYHNSTPIDGTNFRSLTAGIQGQWHMRPFRTLDPWIGLGTAYRASWVVPDVGGNTTQTRLAECPPAGWRGLPCRQRGRPRAVRRRRP